MAERRQVVYLTTLEREVEGTTTMAAAVLCLTLCDCPVCGAWHRRQRWSMTWDPTLQRRWWPQVGGAGAARAVGLVPARQVPACLSCREVRCPVEVTAGRCQWHRDRCLRVVLLTPMVASVGPVALLKCLRTSFRLRPVTGLKGRCHQAVVQVQVQVQVQA